MSRVLILGTLGTEIYSVSFDERRGSLVLLSQLSTEKSPDWITRHPRHDDLIYVATRPVTGGRIDLVRVGQDGVMTMIDSAETGLDDPAHMALLADCSAIVSAHYLGGGVSVLRLQEDGKFVTPRPADGDVFLAPYTTQSHVKQWASHCHGLVIHGDEIIVCDQGSNKVWRMRYTPDTGLKLVKTVDDFQEGDGPRHAVMHPNAKVLYVLQELSSWLSVMSWPDLDSEQEAKCIARIPVYPPSDANHHLSHPMRTAEIAYWNGKVVATNRMSPNPEMDALVVLEADENGQLGEPLWIWPRLKHIRAMSCSPDGKFLCAAGRDAGGVVIYNDKWKECARLEIGNVAVPVFMS